MGAGLKAWSFISWCVRKKEEERWDFIHEISHRLKLRWQKGPLFLSPSFKFEIHKNSKLPLFLNVPWNYVVIIERVWALAGMIFRYSSADTLANPMLTVNNRCRLDWHLPYLRVDASLKQLVWNRPASASSLTIKSSSQLSTTDLTSLAPTLTNQSGCQL